ncbi:MAG TPA: hypothetical protein VE963_18205 [Reyranella sp.]|nr:hypothetical protein [Reyranella sp.]
MSRTLTTLSLLAGCTLAVSLAHAQSSADAARDPKGIVSPWTNSAEAAFVTEEIRGAGYSGVNSLERKSDGTWIARAYKGPADVLVAVDHSGHIREMSR